jgi:hypothetical protein
MVSRVKILLEKTSNSDSGGLSLSATATYTKAKTVWILHFRADSASSYSTQLTHCKQFLKEIQSTNNYLKQIQIMHI